MKERIQKVLAAAGVASRRAIEDMVEQGRIKVNGKLVFALPVMVDPEEDRVAIDDELVNLKIAKEEPNIYVLLHKPKHVYSTNVAQGEQRRAVDLLPPDFPRVYPVGRLDAESTGLLLLTNDGELTHQLTHPKFGVPKTYSAVIDGKLSERDIEKLMTGIWLADPKKGEGFKTGRSFVQITQRLRDTTVIEVTIREGRNRQIRRMLAAIGHKVKQLTRIRMGPLTLKGVGVGQFRLLTQREVKSLYDLPAQQQERYETIQKLKAEKKQKREQRDLRPGELAAGRQTKSVRSGPRKPPRR